MSDIKCNGTVESRHRDYNGALAQVQWLLRSKRQIMIYFDHAAAEWVVGTPYIPPAPNKEIA